MVIGIAAVLTAICAPAVAVAEGTAQDATLALPAPSADPVQILEQDLTLKLAPDLYADPAAAPAPATGGAKPEGAKPGEAEKPKGHCPPLPLYNIEGTGGTLLVPMAYLVNCGWPGTSISYPSVGYTMVRAGTKTVQEIHLSETLYRRIEIGYTMGTLDLGDFPRDVYRATGVDIGFDHVVLHNFNLRGMVIEEGKYNPAVTAGATFKYNPNVQDIDRRLGGGVRALGMARSNSVDYTLTASKTVVEPCFKRPVILTGGIRFSEAAQLGYLGFGDTYRMTGEGSVAYLITDWLAIAYEYRQKKNPYDTLGTLVGKEGAWQAVDFAFILSDRLTFAVGWLCAGNVANGRVDNGWGFQLKYEF
jgi:hypothetical protein